MGEPIGHTKIEFVIDLDFIPNLKKTRAQLYSYSSHKLIIIGKFGTFRFPVGFDDIKMVDPDNRAPPETNSNPGTNIMRVSVKLPPFWREQPELWFTQAEAQFVISGITVDETKYYTVIATVESDILSQISDIVSNPPAADKYKTIKDRLIKRFADSEQKKLKKLLSEISLGDRTPSQLLIEMRRLANFKIQDAFLQTMWLNCLPQQVKAIISTVEGNLDKLAKTADRIFEVTDCNNIAAVSKKSDTSLENRVATIEKQLEETNNMLKQLLSRNRSRSRSKPRDSTESNQQASMCRFHAKFAEKAYRCIKPCTYIPKN